MNFASFSVKRPVLVTVAALVVVVIGLMSLLRLPLDLLPSMNTPVVAIVTVFPGASAQEMSDLVAKPLELAAATTPGVTSTRSIAQENVATVIITFDWGTNMNQSREELRSRIDQVSLPDGAEDPVLTKFDPSAVPVMQINVSNGSDMASLTQVVHDLVVPRLELVDGVANVSVLGGREEQVRVELDQAKLDQYHLSPAQVAAMIRASNLNAPLGSLNEDGRRLNIRLVGKESGIEELRDLELFRMPATPSGEAAAAMPGRSKQGGDPPQPAAVVVRLKDVANVTLGEAERSSLVRTGGKPTIGLAIQKESNANTVVVADEIHKALDDLQKDHEDLTVTVLTDSAGIIRTSIEDLTRDLVSGGLLAIAILWLFLGSFRTTLISAISIPVSIIGAFALLFSFGKGLNLMTLGGLILAVGMVVDDSIVVVEAIQRHLEQGKTPSVAARDGTAEVLTAVISSTLSTVAVFLPIAFVPGLAGEFFRELALTVAFALIASLAVSLTVVPMVASRVLKPSRRAAAQPSQTQRRDVVPRSAVTRAYRVLLDWVLSRRALTLVVAAAILAGSLWLVPEVGTEFLPSTDEGQFQITLKMPSDAALSATDDKVREIEAVLADQPDVESFSVTVGAGEGLSAMLGGGADAPSARAVFLVTQKEDVDRTTQETMDDVRRSVEKVASPATVAFETQSVILQTVGGLGNGLQLSVSAPDRTTLEKVLPDVEQAVRKVDGVTSVSSTLSSRKPELQVTVDRSKALQYGLTPGQVAMSVSLAVKGENISRLEQGDDSYDIFVSLRPEDRNSEAKLGEVKVATATGQQVPLKNFAQIQRASGPVSITYENRRVSAELTGTFSNRDLGSVSSDVTQNIDDLDLPDTVRVKQTGMASLMREGFEGMTLTLALAIVLVFMVMAAEFESFLHPFVILLSLPMAIAGVVVTLWASGYHFGITAFMGVIMLVGIVVKNGIIMIDYINQLRAAGWGLREAVLDGAAVRVRPVLMTALTTALGMLPLALGMGGAGAKLEAPLAIAVVGGLTSSTLLTLVVVPTVYTLFNRGFHARASREARHSGETREVHERPVAPDSLETREARRSNWENVRPSRLTQADAREPLAEASGATGVEPAAERPAETPGANTPAASVSLSGEEAQILAALLRRLTRTGDSSESA